MPVRVKPCHDFGPCTLTLESIRAISELVQKDFPNAVYHAVDGVWEVYDEPSGPFIAAIFEPKKLDSFRIKAKASPSDSERGIQTS